LLNFQINIVKFTFPSCQLYIVILPNCQIYFTMDWLIEFQTIHKF
jgi:hypothetical protein